MLETTESNGTAQSPEQEQAAYSGLVRNVSDALGALDYERVRKYVADLRAPDLADLIENLHPNERVAFIQALGTEIDLDERRNVDVPGQVDGALAVFVAHGCLNGGAQDPTRPREVVRRRRLTREDRDDCCQSNSRDFPHSIFPSCRGVHEPQK